MNKMHYAAIKSSQENMKDIQAMAESVMHAPTTAFKTMKEILAKVEKWNHDFGNCDPAWVPPVTEKPTARQNAMALGAFVQS